MAMIGVYVEDFKPKEPGHYIRPWYNGETLEFFICDEKGNNLAHVMSVMKNQEGKYFIRRYVIKGKYAGIEDEVTFDPDTEGKIKVV